MLLQQPLISCKLVYYEMHCRKKCCNELRPWPTNVSVFACVCVWQCYSVICVFLGQDPSQYLIVFVRRAKHTAICYWFTVTQKSPCFPYHLLSIPACTWWNAGQVASLSQSTCISQELFRISDSCGRKFTHASLMWFDCAANIRTDTQTVSFVFVLPLMCP